MKRTVNIKGLLITCGVLITPVILYLIGYWIPDTFKMTQTTSLYNAVVGRIIDGLMAVLFVVICIGALALFIICAYHIFNYIFPKNSFPDKPNRDGD